MLKKLRCVFKVNDDKKNIPNKYIGHALYKLLEQQWVFERFIYAVTKSQHCLYSCYGRLVFIELFVDAYNLETLENHSANKIGILSRKKFEFDEHVNFFFVT